MADFEDFTASRGDSNGQPSLWNPSTVLPIIIGTLIAIILSTRFLSGTKRSTPSTDSKYAFYSPILPYWLPVLGHLPSFIYSPESFLEHARESCLQGVFAVKLGRRKRTFVISPTLIKNLSLKQDFLKPHGETAFVKTAYGVPSKSISELELALPRLQAELSNIFECPTPSQKLIDSTIYQLQNQLPNLVTFMDRAIDQEIWEKASNTEVLEDGLTVETNLFQLVQTFLVCLTTSQFVSPDILSDTPDLAPILLMLPSQIMHLLTRPRMMAPHPNLVLYTALDKLSPFLDSMYPEGEDSSGQQFSSPFLSLLQSSGIESQLVRSSILLYLLHYSLVGHVLIPWTLLHLFSSPDLRNKAVAESSGSVKVTQAPGIGSISPPPDLKFGKLSQEKNAVLYSGLAESLRLYGRGWSEYAASKDGTVEGDDDDIWAVEKDEVLVLTPWLGREGGKKWDGERYMAREDAFLEESLSQLGKFILPGSIPFYSRLYIAFLAGMFSLWEIEPVGSQKALRIPSARFAPGVAVPREDVRVRIRKRKTDTKGTGDEA